MIFTTQIFSFPLAYIKYLQLVVPDEKVQDLTTYFEEMYYFIDQAIVSPDFVEGMKMAEEKNEPLTPMSLLLDFKNLTLSPKLKD